MSNPAGLPYEVTMVVHATDTDSEKRTAFAAFADASVADWFTNQLTCHPGTHFETVGLVPPEFDGLPPGTLPALATDG